MNDRSALLTVALSVLLLVVAFSGPAVAHTGDDGSHHHDGPMGSHNGMGWGMGWGLWFLWPALLVLAAGAVAYVLLTPGRDGRDSENSDEDEALSVLRERYARGEIDDDEFERRREALDSGR